MVHMECLKHHSGIFGVRKPGGLISKNCSPDICPRVQLAISLKEEVMYWLIRMEQFNSIMLALALQTGLQLNQFWRMCNQRAQIVAVRFRQTDKWKSTYKIKILSQQH